MRFVVAIINSIICTPPLLLVLINGFITYLIGRIFKFKKTREYGLEIMITVDELGGVIMTLGRREETISAKTGRAMNTGDPKWFVPPFCAALDKVAEWMGDPNHSRNAVDPELEKKLNAMPEHWPWMKKRTKLKLMAELNQEAPIE